MSVFEACALLRILIDQNILFKVFFGFFSSKKKRGRKKYFFLEAKAKEIDFSAKF